MDVAIASAQRIGELELFPMQIASCIFRDVFKPLDNGDTVVISFGAETDDGAQNEALQELHDLMPENKNFYHMAVVFHPQVQRPMLVALMLPAVHSIGVAALDVLCNEDTCVALVAARPFANANDSAAVNNLDDQIFRIPRTDPTGGGQTHCPTTTTSAFWTLELRSDLLTCPLEREMLHIQSRVVMTNITWPPCQPLQLQGLFPTHLFPTVEGDGESTCQLPYCRCGNIPHTNTEENNNGI